MELKLTKKQQSYLNKSSPLRAATLRRVYKKSVQDQQRTLKRASQL